MSHTITITALSGEDRDEPEYTVSGDCTGDPVVFNTCKHADCDGVETDGDTKDEERHGLTHLSWEGGWCAETDECPLKYVGDLHFAVDEFGRLGTFPLEIEWEEDWCARPFDDGSEADA